MRVHRSLNGQWQFQLDPDGNLSVGSLAPDRQITVPLPWQAAFPDLEQYGGFAWYRTTLAVEQSWLGGHLMLTFGAVDYWCQVFVNGQIVCEHEGGYTPFTAHIEKVAHAGDNEIAVRVYDPRQDSIVYPRWPDSDGIAAEPTQPPFDARNIPHGKQEWYVSVGGIWQDVTLTAVSRTYIDHVHITTDIHSGEVEARVELAGSGEGGMLRVVIEGTTADVSTPLVAGQIAYTIKAKVENPNLWTPEAPNLYTLSVSLSGGETADDALKSRFGFREITTKDGYLLLNGAPLYLRSALDQDLYEPTIYTVPSEAYLRDEFQKAKALGLNSLRTHIKVADPLYYDLADELGLLIWTEIPSWRTFPLKGTIHPSFINLDPAIKARASQTLEDMIQRDYNHPSIIAWTIVNEDWGTTLPLSASDRQWIVDMYDLCKRLDPTRLVVDNSPCPTPWGPSIHVKSDLDDFHTYTNIPDQAEHFVEMLEGLDTHPLWSYSSHGEAQRTGKEPIIMSEFGNWGLPALRGLREANGGNDPAWFTLGPWWSSFDGESGWPRGVEERFTAFGLDKIWPDYDTFATATQWHQFRALKFELETMRRLTHVMGYVITELSDIYWESNGLLDFNREPKVYHDKFATVNAADVIVPQISRYAFWENETVSFRLYGSHYSAADWSGAKVAWSLNEQHDEETVSSLAPGKVQDFGTKSIKLPPVSEVKTVEIALSVNSASGGQLANNTLEVLVLPTSAGKAAYSGPVSVMTRRHPFSAEDSSKLVKVLKTLGYDSTVKLSAETKLVISNRVDPQLMEWLRGGGDMLFLSERPGPFFWHASRHGGYHGSWMTSFAWLRPGAYKRLNNVASPLSLPFIEVMPRAVILGLPVENPATHEDCLAGQITGWVNHPAIHTVQFRYGKGRVIMTTYDLRDTLEDDRPDAVAVAMLHDLVDRLVTCNPTITANY